MPNLCCQERYEKISEFIPFKAQMIVLNLNSILVGLIRFFLWSLKDYYKKCTEKRTLTTIIAFGLNFKLPHKRTRIFGKQNQKCQLWPKMSSKYRNLIFFQDFFFFLTISILSYVPSQHTLMSCRHTQWRKCKSELRNKWALGKRRDSGLLDDLG